MKSARDLPCPTCDGPMGQVERRGVLIDSCRDCGLAFLDRGELDKLFDQAEPDMGVEGVGNDRRPGPKDPDDDHDSGNRSAGGGRSKQGHPRW